MIPISRPLTSLHLQSCFFQNKVIWTESGAQEVDVSCWGHIQLPVVIFYYVEDIKMQGKMGQDL